MVVLILVLTLFCWCHNYFVCVSVFLLYRSALSAGALEVLALHILLFRHLCSWRLGLWLSSSSDIWNIPSICHLGSTTLAAVLHSVLCYRGLAVPPQFSILEKTGDGHCIGQRPAHRHSMVMEKSPQALTLRRVLHSLDACLEQSGLARI